MVETESRPSRSHKQLQVARQAWPLAKNYYQKARQTQQEKKLIGWHLGLSPYELLHALDVLPVMPENFSSVLAAKQMIRHYLEKADSLGYSRVQCSLHHTILGYALSGEELMIPPPDFILATNNPCDVTSRSFLPVQKHLGIPYYYLDIPYFGDMSDGEEAAEDQRDYCIGQLKELIAFIEDISGNPMDEERFCETFQLAAQTYALWREISDLRKAVPCPMGAVEEFGTLYPLLQLVGTREAVGFYQMLLAEVRQRVKEKKGILSVEEKHRLLWVGSVPYYDSGMLNYVEEFGALVVKADAGSAYEIPFDPDRPLESLVHKIIVHPFNASLELRTRAVQRQIRDYQVDGVIFYAHVGCRNFCGGVKAIQDSLLKDLGVPSLLIEGDMIDAEGYSASVTREQIREFLVTLR